MVAVFLIIQITKDMDPVFQKFRATFIEEASGLLDQLEKDLLDLETSPESRELIESVFRAMHTIKGISAMYGFDHISEFTHNLESLYQAIRDKVVKFDKPIFDTTFLSVDHIRKLLSDETLTVAENQGNHKKLMADIEALLNSYISGVVGGEVAESSSQAMASTWHILIRTNEQIYFRGISLTGLLFDLAAIGKYEISRLDDLSNAEVDVWSIILYSNSRESEIREVFMFIEDDCTITRLTSHNLFENYNPEPNDNEQSILDFIENPGINTKAAAIETAPVANTDSKKTNSKGAQRISVDSAKLDHLMYLVSELITLNSQFNLTTSSYNYEKIMPFTERLDNLSKQFRNNALDIRLVPLSESLVRFKRLIRDLSRQLNKEVELVMDGIDTEVDKGTIDQLNDPLMHIIRNCVDHGIELPHIRKQKGKPAAGTIRISASNSGNFVIIRIDDDGAGIDLEKIKQKAIDKGIIKATDNPGKQELLDIIFLPGFSTAQNLTEVSGRGVGMDVVKRKIIELRGEIIVDTEQGIGTSLTLKLQQSIAITDTLLFKVEDTFFTVPISDIDICMQVPSNEIIERKNTCTIPYKDDLIPFMDLRSHFKLEGEYGEWIKVVIIRNNDKLLAILTDTIIGGHQAVLKTLGNLFRDQKCIAAASQLGDGQLAFMLDANELFLTNNII
jgi:two-component system chemotaxis sensor kinase CheA